MITPIKVAFTELRAALECCYITRQIDGTADGTDWSCGQCQSSHALSRAAVDHDEGCIMPAVDALNNAIEAAEAAAAVSQPFNFYLELYLRKPTEAPPKVLAAAHLLESHAQKAGWKYWTLCGVADHHLIGALLARIEHEKNERKRSDHFREELRTVLRTVTEERDQLRAQVVSCSTAT